MKRKLMFALLATSLSSAAFAGQNNVGTCGWGSKVFENQSGIAPQALAATTNSVGPQTFGVTSGTSGCTQDGTVTSSWKVAMFLDGNMNKLARDMSVGQGEVLESLAALIGVEESQKTAFYQLTKANFSHIFSSDVATAEQVRLGLKDVLVADETFAGYAAKV
jgi:hypothetical protein